MNEFEDYRHLREDQAAWFEPDPQNAHGRVHDALLTEYDDPSIGADQHVHQHWRYQEKSEESAVRRAGDRIGNRVAENETNERDDDADPKCRRKGTGDGRI